MKQLNKPIEHVLKTLVIHGDKTGIFTCVIPVGEEVSLKMAVKTTGSKNCNLVPIKEVLHLTVNVLGGLHL